MATITAEQSKVLRLIVEAVVDTVKEAGEDGAPGGILYAALMTQGCSYNQFTSLMGALMRNGTLRLENDCYYLAQSH